MLGKASPLRPNQVEAEFGILVMAFSPSGLTQMDHQLESPRSIQQEYLRTLGALPSFYTPPRHLL
jgi:hypothetical protein